MLQLHFFRHQFFFFHHVFSGINCFPVFILTEWFIYHICLSICIPPELFSLLIIMARRCVNGQICAIFANKTGMRWKCCFNFPVFIVLQISLYMYVGSKWVFVCVASKLFSIEIAYTLSVFWRVESVSPWSPTFSVPILPCWW